MMEENKVILVPMKLARSMRWFRVRNKKEEIRGSFNLELYQKYLKAIK